MAGCVELKFVKLLLVALFALFGKTANNPIANKLHKQINDTRPYQRLV